MVNNLKLNVPLFLFWQIVRQDDNDNLIDSEHLLNTRYVCGTGPSTVHTITDIHSTTTLSMSTITPIFIDKEREG